MPKTSVSRVKEVLITLTTAIILGLFDYYVLYAHISFENHFLISLLMVWLLFCSVGYIIISISWLVPRKMFSELSEEEKEEKRKLFPNLYCPDLRHNEPYIHIHHTYEHRDDGWF